MTEDVRPSHHRRTPATNRQFLQSGPRSESGFRRHSSRLDKTQTTVFTTSQKSATTDVRQAFRATFRRGSTPLALAACSRDACLAWSAGRHSRSDTTVAIALRFEVQPKLSENSSLGFFRFVASVRPSGNTSHRGLANPLAGGRDGERLRSSQTKDVSPRSLRHHLPEQLLSVLPAPARDPPVSELASSSTQPAYFVSTSKSRNS